MPKALVRLHGLLWETIRKALARLHFAVCICDKYPFLMGWLISVYAFEPPHDKTNKMACAPSENSVQPGHPPCLISLCCPLEDS